MGFGGTTTKGQRFPVEILNPEEVQALIDNASKRFASGIRDRALIATLYRAGLRVSEALDLMPKDVDLVSGVVQVLDGKGHKARVVAVDDGTLELLRRWIDARTKRGINGKNRLFCTLAGGELSRVQVTQRLKALAEKAGIEKRVHPHGLRHARAVDLVRRGVAMPTIQAALGHTSLATTQTYVNHIAPTAVIDAMREA